MSGNAASNSRSRQGRCKEDAPTLLSRSTALSTFVSLLISLFNYRIEAFASLLDHPLVLSCLSPSLFAIEHFISKNFAA